MASQVHFALIAACNMPVLIAFCKTANDLCDRYRRIYLPFIRPVDRLKDHNRIAERRANATAVWRSSCWRSMSAAPSPSSSRA